MHCRKLLASRPFHHIGNEEAAECGGFSLEYNGHGPPHHLHVALPQGGNIKDPHHPSHALFSLLPMRKEYRSHKSHTTGIRNSYFLTTIRFFNHFAKLLSHLCNGTYRLPLGVDFLIVFYTVFFLTLCRIYQM